MKETLRLIITLFVICLISGALLAGVDAMTRDRIESANRTRKLSALQAVLPPHDNAPDTDTVTVAHHGQDWTFFIARHNGKFAGAAVETASEEGYGGGIRLMLGIDAEGQSVGIAMLDQKETPGLGANIAAPAFRARFAGRDLRATDWRISKDGGDIDHITAATLSSRAVSMAVQSAIAAYLANLAVIQNTEH